MLTKTKNGCFWHGEAVTEDRYNEILSMLRNPPAAPGGYGCRLKADLTWELYELPAEDPDPELTDGEALDILLGGAGA